MAASTAEINISVNEQLKNYDDTTTELAEMLDGSMRTPLEFIFDGQELHGRDGRKLSEIADTGLRRRSK